MKLALIALILMASSTAQASAKEALDYFSCKSPLNEEQAKNCRFLSTNLCRDTFRKEVSPSAVFDRQASSITRNHKTSRGHLFYMGFVPKRYHYRVTSDDQGVLNVTVRVWISNSEDFNLADLSRLRDKLWEAKQIWESGANPIFYPEPIFSGSATLYLPIRFHFELSGKKSADYHVRLTRKSSRGPYNTEWSLRWTGFTLAHELGHMMGLDDEYNLEASILKRPAPPTIYDQCDRTSLMCHSDDHSTPKAHHYYLILRRL